MTSLLSFFPTTRGIKAPRDAQVTAIDLIEKSLTKGNNVIFAQLPTGIGKSPLAIALCEAFRSGYICTATKQLQEQYLRDFSDRIFTVKGRSNFECFSNGDTCAKGRCKKDPAYKCKKKVSPDGEGDLAAVSAARGELHWMQPTVEGDGFGKCEYWKAKTDAMNATIAIHNYTYLLTEANYIGDFGKRNIMISDEGHNIESQIMNFIKVDITPYFLEVINKCSGKDFIFAQPDYYAPMQEKLKEHIEWLKSIYGTINEVVENISIIVTALSKDTNANIIKEMCKEIGILDERRQDTIIEVWYEINYMKSSGHLETRKQGEQAHMRLSEDMRTLELAIKKIDFIFEDIETHADNWIVHEDRTMQGVYGIEFKPIFIRQYAKEKYFNLAHVNIIMSATILDYKKMAYDLGLDNNGTYAGVDFIKIPPVFPNSSNNIFHLSIGNLKHNVGDTEQDFTNLYKKITERIDLILDRHPNEKGIIHCNNYRISRIIDSYTRHPDRILAHNDKNRLAVLSEHTDPRNDRPTVLCSPAMYEGVDLKDDLSRFQILVKVPYPNTGDEQIAARLAVDKEFYDLKTASIIIQAIGRSVRSETDHAVTYTIDSRFETFARTHRATMKELYSDYVRKTPDLVQFWGCKGNDVSKVVASVTPKKESEFGYDDGFRSRSRSKQMKITQT